jgi:hypothetical protein
LSEAEEAMARCPRCGGYLICEPALLDDPARVRCVTGDWAFSDPNFRKEKPRYFPPESVDKKIGWQQEHPGYDLYDPRSAAAQLGISMSFLKYSVRNDSSAPVIMGRGMIACNTPALQEWWDGKAHHYLRAK